MTLAGVAVFSYVTLVPAMVWGGLRYYGVSAFGLVQLLCLYGYGILVFIPAAVSNTLPIVLHP